VKYSVVIPAFNSERTIGRAIKSVLGQTLAASEILMVDDGSIDKTADIARLQSHGKATIIRHAVQSGAGAARNTGVAHSKSDWIAFLDADDWWEPNKMQCQLDILLKNPRWVVCATSYFLHRRGRVMPQKFTGPQPNQHIGDYLFTDLGQFHTSTVVGARELFVANEFREDLPRHQDWRLLLELQKQSASFICLEKVLSNRCFDNARAAKAKLSADFLEGSQSLISLSGIVGFYCNILLPKQIKQKDVKGCAKTLIKCLDVMSDLGISSFSVVARIIRSNMRRRVLRNISACVAEKSAASRM